jgi:hypothetical protein
MQWAGGKVAQKAPEGLQHFRPHDAEFQLAFVFEKRGERLCHLRGQGFELGLLRFNDEPLRRVRRLAKVALVPVRAALLLVLDQRNLPVEQLLLFAQRRKLGNSVRVFWGSLCRCFQLRDSGRYAVPVCFEFGQRLMARR